MKTTKNSFNLGGQAIASGGFGCVFLPPLKCKGAERPVGKVVSKLLTNNNAKAEFNEAKEIQSILKKKLSLDVYNRYFIFPEKLCKPDTLTKADLVNFEDKCRNLTKKGITSDIINQSLDSVRIIELTNGGNDLSKAIKGMKTNVDLGKLNRVIIELLTNAVVPMNRLGILHFDLKSANILVDDNYQLRLIDWGLSVVAKGNKIPSGSTSRPIQYNLPFSTVLFNKEIINDINRELKQLFFDTNYKEAIRPELSTIVHKVVVKYFSNTDSGHIGYVSGNIKKLFNITGEKKFFIYNLLSNYLTEAIINFINPKTKTFDDTKYFNDVCAKNCDIWGVITVYNDILIHYEGLSLFKFNTSDELKQLRLFVMRYLYSPEFAGKPIDVDILIAELKDIIPFSGTIKKTSKSLSVKKDSVIDLVSDDSVNPSPVKKDSVIDIVSDDSVNPSPVKTKTRRKRCKNGTRRSRKTGECENTNKVVVPLQAEPIVESSGDTSSLLRSMGLFKKDTNIQAVKKQKVVIGEKRTRKRCKNGTRRNKKTGECDNINGPQKLTTNTESINTAIVEPANTTTTVESTQDAVEPPSLFTRLGF